MYCHRYTADFLECAVPSHLGGGNSDSLVCVRQRSSEGGTPLVHGRALRVRDLICFGHMVRHP